MRSAWAAAWCSPSAENSRCQLDPRHTVSVDTVSGRCLGNVSWVHSTPPGGGSRPLAGGGLGLQEHCPAEVLAPSARRALLRSLLCPPSYLSLEAGWGRCFLPWGHLLEPSFSLLTPHLPLDPALRVVLFSGDSSLGFDLRSLVSHFFIPPIPCAYARQVNFHKISQWPCSFFTQNPSVAYLGLGINPSFIS